MKPAFRLIPLGVFAALAVAASGCGSTTVQASSSSESGAKFVRSGALAFVALNTDLDSSQWQQLDDLAKKFPGRDKVLQRIDGALAKYGVDLQDDVEPALGPEVDIAVALGAGGRDSAVVALTRPDDPDKFKALVAKLNAADSEGKPVVYRVVDGWYALSDSQVSIDRVLAGGGQPLADDSTFQEAQGKLSGDALVKAFVDGRQLGAAVKQAQRKSSAVGASSLGFDNLDFIAASTSVEDDGIRVHGATGGNAAAGSDFAAKLLGNVPGDALAVLDFRGAGIADRIEKLESNPKVDRMFRQVEAALGVSYDDILDLLHNEVALYVRPGAGIPEVTLALETKDQAKALSTLDRLGARLAAATGGQLKTETQGGHEVKTLDLGRFSVHYGVVDGTVVITSGLTGISDYGAAGQRLPDSADFKQAQEAAGMPDSTGGFLYLNLKNSIPLLEGLAALAGKSPPAEVTENLRPLRSLLAWTDRSGDSRTFDAFLEIK
jgi:uncharacterized protein DUF3352